MLKDGYTVLDFSNKINFFNSWGYQNMEFVGGQNKCVIVTCKESFLNRDPFKSIIDSYASIPLLARISPSVITALSKASKNHTTVSLSISSISESSEQLLNLDFTGSEPNSDTKEEEEEENSKSSNHTDSLFSSCYHHPISESIEVF